MKHEDFIKIQEQRSEERRRHYELLHPDKPSGTDFEHMDDLQKADTIGKYLYALCWILIFIRACIDAEGIEAAVIETLVVYALFKLFRKAKFIIVLITKILHPKRTIQEIREETQARKLAYHDPSRTLIDNPVGRLMRYGTMLAGSAFVWYKHRFLEEVQPTIHIPHLLTIDQQDVVITICVALGYAGSYVLYNYHNEWKKTFCTRAHCAASYFAGSVAAVMLYDSARMLTAITLSVAAVWAICLGFDRMDARETEEKYARYYKDDTDEDTD
jgi:hypothetical protein